MTEVELEKFLSRIAPEPNSGCWLWDGTVDRGGYARLRAAYDDGRRDSRTAHRLSYEHFVGPIPPGMVVCHRCDVRCCVNPGHLFVGTQHDNIEDMRKKGRARGPAGERHGSRTMPHCVARGERMPNAKLTEDDVRYIRAGVASGAFGHREIARKFGVAHSVINRIVRREKWAHV